MRKRNFCNFKTPSHQFILYNVWTFKFAYQRSSVKTPAWLHYDSIHSKMIKLEMETQRNTRARLWNISYMCILEWFRKKKKWFTFSSNGKFLIRISLIKEKPHKMTKAALLSLLMFSFFIVPYKQWQRNLKLTSISNLKMFFFGGGGVGECIMGNSKMDNRTSFSWYGLKQALHSKLPTHLDRRMNFRSRYYYHNRNHNTNGN